MGITVSGATIAGAKNAATSFTATVIYVIAEGHNGNFGGRAGYDAWCAARVPTNLSAYSPTNIHAFVSVIDTDEIRDMPTVYGFNSASPVYWWDDSKKSLTKLATSWTDMLDSSILASQLAGTGISTVNGMWTGSNANGSLFSIANACSSGGIGWTSASISANGRWGSGIVVNSQWQNYDNTYCSTVLPYSRAICTVTFS